SHQPPPSDRSSRDRLRVAGQPTYRAAGSCAHARSLSASRARPPHHQQTPVTPKSNPAPALPSASRSRSTSPPARNAPRATCSPGSTCAGTTGTPGCDRSTYPASPQSPGTAPQSPACRRRASEYHKRETRASESMDAGGCPTNLLAVVDAARLDQQLDVTLEIEV